MPARRSVARALAAGSLALAACDDGSTVTSPSFGPDAASASHASASSSSVERPPDAGGSASSSATASSSVTAASALSSARVLGSTSTSSVATVSSAATVSSSATASSSASGSTGVEVVAASVFHDCYSDFVPLAVSGRAFWGAAGAPGADAGAIVSASVDGGAPTTVAPAVCPIAVAVDADNVYWLDLTTPASASIVGPIVTQVLQAPRGGGEVVTLATRDAYGYGLAVDGASVYWTEFGDAQGATGITGTTGAVARVPIGGGDVSTIAALSGLGEESTSVAVDGTDVYWTEYGDSASDGVILRRAAAGGATSTFASGQVAPYAVFVDATDVYWATSYDGFVRASKAGGAPVTLVVASRMPAIGGAAADSTGVYWSAFVGDTVSSVGPDGGAPRLVATAPGYSSGGSVALDETSVYWVAGTGVIAQSILRAPKN